MVNPHKTRKLKKGSRITVYPLGFIEQKADFCDILSNKWGFVACVNAIKHPHSVEDMKELKIKGECVRWCEEGYPDIYVDAKSIGIEEMNYGLRMLEKDKRNRLKYRLIPKNFMDFVKPDEDSVLGDIKRKMIEGNAQSDAVSWEEAKKQLKLTEGC